ncbi:MAG TPA: hypothetical protein VK462_01305 [Nitrososphaeraceae archaeon]|jgi:hypothetical protein|nr:hypothetical protein [Nitrososphaeraceae archaeon]
MNKVKLTVMLALSTALLVAIGETTLPVFAGGSGDHHDGHDAKCKHNDDNNCNSNEIDQKVDAKNYCEIENKNKDHSRDNENVNDLACENFAQNQNDVASINDLIFGLT